MTANDKKSKSQTKSKHSFQAETKELLNIMINSLYTHREIFLRELISNSSDALDKIHVKSLTNDKVLGDDYELKIHMEVDREAKTLTISDNGIGMTYQEVIDNIGTIAKSGSKSFLENIKNKDDVDLIGKFGVGFYSAFMVSEKVVVISRSANDKRGTRWESTGDGSFTTEHVDKESRGTHITLHIKVGCGDSSLPEEDFLNPYTIQNLVKKYSDYIRYPIEMDFSKEEPAKDKDGKTIEGKTETIIERKKLNSQIPIWEKDKKEIKTEDYFQFFKHHFHDWNEFADVIHSKVEGSIQYTTLLFIPSKAPSNLYDKDYTSGLQLYSNHVFVMNNCNEIFPDHLRFVRGLVDSPDFSLNISREILQHDEQLKIIGKNLEKKVITTLKSLQKDHRKEYEAWWNDFGKAIKGGIYMKYNNKDKLQDLLMFNSSHKDVQGLTSLKDYIDRMPTGQKVLYYAPAKNIESIKRMPQFEVFREKNIEVLYFLDKIDEFLTQNMDEYEGKKLRSITREDLDLDDIIQNPKGKKPEEKKEDPAKNQEKQEFNKLKEKYKDMLEHIKGMLGNSVTDVTLSKRLKISPVCLVNSNTGVTFNMEQLLRGVNQPTANASKIMELNPNHQIFNILENLYKKDKSSDALKKISETLLNQAMLVENYELENPLEFSNTLSDLMMNAYDK
jgi:molecular chaperone HtpG